MPLLSDIEAEVGYRKSLKCWFCGTPEAVRSCWCHARYILDDTPMCVAMEKADPCLCPSLQERLIEMGVKPQRTCANLPNYDKHACCYACHDSSSAASGRMKLIDITIFTATEIGDKTGFMQSFEPYLLCCRVQAKMPLSIRRHPATVSDTSGLTLTGFVYHIKYEDDTTHGEITPNATKSK